MNDPVLDLIERANQRGGRMLSLVDLVERETLSLAQAAWLVGRVEDGSSWLVGARPGGAGKTAVMCALLGFLPPGERVHLAVPEGAWAAARPGECVVAYEIGPGGYDAYVWGAELRRLAALGAAGCRVVSNLHADTPAEVVAQLCGENGVTAAQAAAFGLFLPIRLTDGTPEPRRRVPGVYQATAAGWAATVPPEPLPAREQAVTRFLGDCLHAGTRRVEAVRRAWLAAARFG